MTDTSDLLKQFKAEVTSWMPNGQEIRDWFAEHPTQVFYRKSVSLWLDDLTVEFYLAVNKAVAATSLKCYSSINTSVNVFEFRNQLDEWDEERMDDELEKGTHMHLTKDTSIDMTDTGALDRWARAQLQGFFEWHNQKIKFCQYCMKAIKTGRVCGSCIRHSSRFGCPACTETYGERGYGPQRRMHHSCYLTEKSLYIPY